MADKTADVGGRPDNTPDAVAHDPGPLEDKVGGMLAAMNQGKEYIADEVVDDEPEADITDDTDDGEDDSQTGQESDEDEESDEDDSVSDDDEEDSPEAADASAKSDKTPTLPEVFRRSLAAYGWTDDEIDRDLSISGQKFVEMAAGIHSKRNAEVAQWADAGRKAREIGEVNQQAQYGPVVNGVPQSLQPIDLAKMKAKYGEEEMLDEIITPVNLTIAALNAVLPQIQAGVQSIAQTRTDAATSRIHQFFDAEKFSAYRKFYGGAEHERSPEQLDARRQVLDDAVMIMEGARVSHREFTLEQALEMAHDKASSNFRDQAVRKGIKREVKKRNRGITNKPSKRRSSAKQTGPLTASQLEKKIGGMLKNVF